MCPFCIFFARITFAHALAKPSKVTYLSPEMLKTCLLAFSFPSTWIKALAKSWVAKLCHINILSHSNTLNSIKLYISFYKFLAQEYHVQLAKGVLCTFFVVVSFILCVFWTHDLILYQFLWDQKFHLSQSSWACCILMWVVGIASACLGQLSRLLNLERPIHIMIVIYLTLTWPSCVIWTPELGIGIGRPAFNRWKNHSSTGL